MRFIQLLGLSAALLLAGASSAWAYTYTMTTDYAGESLMVGDSVTVDVFIDVVPPDPGPTIMSIGVVYDDEEFDYNGPAALALPAQCGVCNGAQPSYILYTAGRPATYLSPLQTPYWLQFPVFGSPQVNITFVETGFNVATATGTGIYLATMVFDVTSEGDGTAMIAMEFDNSNAHSTGTIEIDSSTFPLIGTPIMVTVPEPSLGLLAIAGLGSLAFYAHRRRAGR